MTRLSFVLVLLSTCAFVFAAAAPVTTCCSDCPRSVTLRQNEYYELTSTLTCVNNIDVSINATSEDIGDFRVYTLNSGNYTLFKEGAAFYYYTLGSSDNDTQCFGSAEPAGGDVSNLYVVFLNVDVESVTIFYQVDFTCSAGSTTPPTVAPSSSPTTPPTVAPTTPPTDLPSGSPTDFPTALPNSASASWASGSLVAFALALSALVAL